METIEKIFTGERHVRFNNRNTSSRLMNGLDGLYALPKHLDTKQMVIISQELETDNVIESLDLGYCAIGDIGVNLLVHGLTNNTTLTELYLYCNNIGPNSGGDIRELLEKNNTIVKLSIASNNIRREGFYEIINGLCKNKSMKILNLISNHIVIPQMNNIITKLASNKTLTEFNLDYNNICPDVNTYIEKIINRNTKYCNCREKMDIFIKNSNILYTMFPIIDNYVLELCS